MSVKVNKLSLNVSKTNYMLFKHKNDNIDHKIVVDGVRVERVHIIKCLGVKVDEHLNWDEQINAVCRNLSKHMSVFYRVKYILNNDCLKSLFCTMILRYLNYACEIWGNTFETK